jgi:hypothetical protein
VFLFWETAGTAQHFFSLFVNREGEEGEWNRTVETASNSTSFTVDDLNPFTIYFFRIEAKNQVENWIYSSPTTKQNRLEQIIPGLLFAGPHDTPHNYIDIQHDDTQHNTKKTQH